MPTVAADGSKVSISLSADGGLVYNYWVLNSTDNGNTFTAPVMVSALGTNYAALGAADPTSFLFFGDYNRSQRIDCNVYSAWGDGRTGSIKTYFSKYNSCAPLGVREITSVTSDVQLLSVYPVPAKSDLTLQFSSQLAANINVAITDIDGKKVISGQHRLDAGIHQFSVSVAAIAPGAYVLKVLNGDEVIATRNVVVSR